MFWDEEYIVLDSESSFCLHSTVVTIEKSNYFECSVMHPKGVSRKVTWKSK